MHFVIAGRINCPQYSFALMVAQRLTENLPDFTYSKISKKPEDWKRWLLSRCKENDWYHTHSPIIWREIGLKKGKKQLVGDINKFLDLCYDYYGIPRELLSGEHFKKEEMDWFTQRTESEYFQTIQGEANTRRNYRSRQVCITGASCQTAEIVIMELLQIPLQTRENGLEIRLFDSPDKMKKLLGTARDAKNCPGPSGLGNCRVACNIKEAFTNIDLVIVLDCFKRKAKESLVKWLKRNRNAMCALGKSLNKYAPTHCRVIIGSPSSQPICYNATVLASYATKLHVRNIVVVTQDLGRELLGPLTAKIKAPLKNLHCPPVWGFVGLNKYVDVRRTLQKHLYQVPGRRIASQLPQGIEEWVLRTTGCLINENEARGLHVRAFEHKAETFPQLGRMPCLSKATAILDLLRIWGIKQEDGNGEILCLGVYSDGSFNIPRGVYWSQPVILKQGFWVPFPEYPIPRQVQINYYSLFLYTIAALYRTKVKPRMYVPPKPVMVEKEKKKFNFDRVLGEIEMPVIRNDAECVEYLRRLAKDELGIDFEAKITDVIEEEPEVEIAPPEEVKKEKMYCECWRQELRRFQKIAFDVSSTSEVEVDLSENFSGSEFSIINPNPKFSYVSSEEESVKVKPSIQTVQKSQSTISPQTVCSCGALSDGSLCKCLELPKSESVEEKVSTEHFYKDQNAQIFMEDLQDVIYADAYIRDKHVAFQDETKSEERDTPLVKFYGKKDAVRDVQADLKLKDRIKRSERGGEESIGETEEEEREEIQEKKPVCPEALDTRRTIREKKKDKHVKKIEVREKPEKMQEVESGEKYPEDATRDAKFHISIEGLPYDIIGDQGGLEGLDEMQKSRESSKSFRDMYFDKIVPSIQVLQPDSSKTTKSSSEDLILMASEDMGVDSKPYREFMGEQDSLIFLERNLDAAWGAWGDSFFYEEKGEEAEGEGELPKKKVSSEKKIKRQGIPLCCLCRCIVPEGLPCCPCGTTKVVEVFKKESVEVFIQSEDDLVFRVEYFETLLPESEPEMAAPEDESKLPSIQSELSSLLSISEVGRPPLREETPSLESPSEIEPQKPGGGPAKIDPRLLPPESFFPFIVRPENAFKDSVRPRELTKEFIESMGEKPEWQMPDKCAELLNMAKAQLEEKKSKESTESKEKKEKEVGTESMPNLFECEDGQERIKTEFSDMNFFIPHGIENWRMTVQKKYKDWFYEGPKLRDESYYDIAIEEVSDDEFEIDKDIEKYFEK